MEHDWSWTLSEPVPKPRPGPKTRTPNDLDSCKKRRQLFLRLLMECGSITHAAYHAGMGKDTVYRLKRAEPEFARAIQQALECSIERLEDEVVNRALAGPADKASHLLLMFKLKQAKPEYRDAAPQVTVQVGPEQIDRAKQLRLERLARKGLPEPEPE